MKNREAIELIKRVRSGDTCPPGWETLEAFDMAIAALEKQEQANTQNINSTHTSRPNALESLNILEQAKDDKGRVPMSLVRQAFRNVLEQDRWRPFRCRKTTEDDCSSFDYIMDCELPEDGQRILITVNNNGHEPVQMDTFFGGGGEECALDSGYGLCDEAIAWRPLPEAYTEEES